MEHVPTTESYLKKVIRIAKEFDISIDKAPITCDAFHLAFSDPASRQSIFGMIHELDRSAVKKGEPLGLIIRYTVELGEDGIRVGRYADEIPSGQIVELTPTNEAMIFLKIKDNFPTQEFLGPMIVNRPEIEFDTETENLPSLAKEEWQPVPTDGVVCSVSQGTESNIPTELPSHWPDIPVCLGPIRLKFNERFPIVSAGPSQSERGSYLRSPDRPQFTRPLFALASSHSCQSISGLSPPQAIGELGHSASKDVPRPLG